MPDPPIDVRSGHPSSFPIRWQFPNPDALQEALEWWCIMLGISDWSVDVQRKRACELQGLYASVNWTLSRRRATIHLLHCDDLKSLDDPMDEEESLVHELLHVVLAGWTDHVGKGMTEEEGDVFIEQPIDRLSHSLVTLRRGGCHADPLVLGPHAFTFEQPGNLQRMKDSLMAEIRKMNTVVDPVDRQGAP
jgi:hypothetical protein